MQTQPPSRTRIHRSTPHTPGEWWQRHFSDRQTLCSGFVSLSLRRIRRNVHGCAWAVSVTCVNMFVCVDNRARGKGVREREGEREREREKVVGKGMQQAEKDKCHRLLVLVRPC